MADHHPQSDSLRRKGDEKFTPKGDTKKIGIMGGESTGPGDQLKAFSGIAKSTKIDTTKRQKIDTKQSDSPVIKGRKGS
ncbi:hypothetical protein LCGC14_1350060 [marine sediment metagenome]|uniref:Uncharacterized protein n=1 Tax=marine sediment metagenome TaxID=412755 RepID=A0A0F9KBU8_9ZZZZ